MVKNLIACCQGMFSNFIESSPLFGNRDEYSIVSLLPGMLVSIMEFIYENNCIYVVYLYICFAFCMNVVLNQ